MSNHLTLLEKKPAEESTPELLTVRFNNPDGTTMTPALINAIRRVILAETPSMSLGLENNRMIINTSAFNTDYLRDRLALVPVYQEKFNHLKDFVDEPREEYDEEDYEKSNNSDEEVDEYSPDTGEKSLDVKLLFRICDPDDWSQSLKNPDPEPLKVTVNKHLLILKKKPKYLNLKFTLNHLSVNPEQTKKQTEKELGDKQKQTEKVLGDKKSNIKGGAKAESQDEIPVENQDEIPAESQAETTETTNATETTDIISDSSDDFDSDDEELRGKEQITDSSSSTVPKATTSSGPKATTSPKSSDVTSESQDSDELSSEGKNLTTHEEWTTYYEKVTDKEFNAWMKYDFYLLMLKPTEEILHNIVPRIAIGREHCTFAPCTIAGYYFGDKPRPINPGNFARSKQYPEYPAQINLSLESNGHYPNDVVIKQALKILLSKIENFRQHVLDSLDAEAVVFDFEENAKPVINLTERFFHEIQTTKETKELSEVEKENYLVLKVNYEDQTLGQLIAIYGSLYFHELYKSAPSDKQVELLQNSFCSYRRPSPLEYEIQISIKTPSKELWPESFSKDLNNQSRPIQVLMEILNHIELLLHEMSDNFETALKK